MDKQLIEYLPYELDKIRKKEKMMHELRVLTSYHSSNCASYNRILKAQKFNVEKLKHISEVPFLPVRLFKERELKSILDIHVVKVVTSSGTSNQQVSRIFLDKDTALSQTKVLTKIVSSYIGPSRLPMLIIDSPEVIKNRNYFSARGAGILGFSIFASKVVYALDSEMNLNEQVILDFLKENSGKQILLFGFTYIVFECFLKKIQQSTFHYDLSNAILIHGGGWKKLINLSISDQEFKNQFFKITGIKKIYDYYGMAEQTGSIFMQCEFGFLHAPIYAEILIRRPTDFSLADIGEIGIIQVLSILPKSYPGHSLLTEDEGVLLGEDTCLCGRKGKYFKVIGRIKSAEIRGCSDTYE